MSQDQYESKWWINSGKGSLQGPVPAETLQRMFSEGKINEKTLVWRKGLTGFVHLAEAQIFPEGAAGETEATSSSRDVAWFYTIRGKQLGPVSVEELRDLVARRDINRETPVWRKGLASWVPFVKPKSWPSYQIRHRP